MDITTHYTKVTKTARYSTYGILSERTKYLWIALHGSNMVCEQMLYKFAEFDPNVHFVIAPEGLSRFYSNGFGGDVVAAWMTKRDRLEEIEDFSNYLSDLLNQYRNKVGSKCKTIAMGFSQGGTTMYRWLHRNQCTLDAILGYSCWIPEDINLSESQTSLDIPNHIYTYGQEDEFLTPERMKMVKKVISNNRLSIVIEPYNGLHRIEKKQLKSIFSAYFESP